MLSKSLKETNPYLRDAELRKALIYQSVSSSTAIESVLTRYPRIPKRIEKKLISIAVHESEASCG